MKEKTRVESENQLKAGAAFHAKVIANKSNCGWEWCSSIVNQKYDEDKLQALWGVLICSAGTTPEANKWLYEGVIKKAFNADKLTQAFEVLLSKNITPEANQWLYERVIGYSVYADKLAPAFEFLLSNNITPEANPWLYEGVIKNSVYADELTQAFEVLLSNNITPEANPWLYERVIGYSVYPDKLARAFDFLLSRNITPDDYQWLYEGVIEKGSSADKLAPAFEFLLSRNITPEDYQWLYEGVIKKACFADNLRQTFEVLLSNNITPEANPWLYEGVIEKGSSADKLAPAFEILLSSNITPEANPWLYEGVIKKSNVVDKLTQAFESLLSRNVTPNKHRLLYKSIISNPSFAFKIPRIYEFFYSKGLTTEANEWLYIGMFKNAFNIGGLEQTFNLLYSNGISPEVYRWLYDKVFEKANEAHNLCQGFEYLLLRNITPKIHRWLYESVIDSAYFANLIPQLFEYFFSNGITIETNLSFYKSIIKKITYADKVVQIFEFLCSKGITIESYPILYESIIQKVEHANNLIEAFKYLLSKNITPKTHCWLYECVIVTSHVADLIPQGLDSLFIKGITLEKNSVLYQSVIKNIFYADNLSEAFGYLLSKNITPEDYQWLYEGVIENGSSADKLAPAFEFLLSRNITQEDYQWLYEGVIENGSSADKLAPAFEFLLSRNITPEDYQWLYEGVIEKGSSADKLARAFDFLLSRNITPDDYQWLYERVIGYSVYADKLAPAFEILLSKNITPEANPWLYECVIKNSFNADNLSEAFGYLISKNITPESHQALYEIVIDNADSADSISKAFEYLLSKGIMIQTHKALYEEVIKNNEIILLFKQIESYISDEDLCRHAEFIISHLELIRDLNTFFSSYLALAAIRKNIFHITCEQHLSQRLLIRAISSLKSYLDKRDDINQSDEEICLLLFEKAIKMTYEAGPLNKSADTRKLEALLARLAESKLSDIECTYDKAIGYTITVDGQFHAINLLFKAANLSHLSLTDEIIGKLQTLLAKLDETSVSGVKIDYEVTKHLPAGLTFALQKYIGTAQYKNINRLQRGLPFDEDPMYQWLIPTNGKENILVNFISACLINQAASRLMECGSNNDNERTLDRGERLTHEELKRRLANPISVPSVTSFSTLKDGSPYFHGSDTIRTKLGGMFSRLPVINRSEGEVLIPHGMRLMYSQDNYGNLRAELINSPSLECCANYYSQLALFEAFKHHLSKDYEDELSFILISGEYITRPNHGLAHVSRVVELIDVVISYFSQHAIDAEFKAFCQNISPDIINQLRIAAAFSVTGRESEIAAGQNIERYNEYRESSKNHLQEFFEREPKAVVSDEIKERLCHVVRYMGNPNYAVRTSDKSAINPHKNEEERRLRIYYYLILTIAHKLDLPRCYSPLDFRRDKAFCLSLSDEQRINQDEILRGDFRQLLNYSIGLIKAHGNALQTDIAPDGRLVSNPDYYKGPVFTEASSSLLRAEALINTVEKPMFQLCKTASIEIPCDDGLPKTPKKEEEQLARWAINKWRASIWQKNNLNLSRGRKRAASEPPETLQPPPKRHKKMPPSRKRAASEPPPEMLQPPLKRHK